MKQQHIEAHMLHAGHGPHSCNGRTDGYLCGNLLVRGPLTVQLLLMVIVVADDPGLYSSQNEQDTRMVARAAQLPVLEPSDSFEVCGAYLHACLICAPGNSLIAKHNDFLLL